MATAKKTSDREEKLLSAALQELNGYANRNDIVKTAADLEFSIGHVERILRGTIHNMDTAKKIYDHLRTLTLKRSQNIQQKLQRA